MVAYIPIPDGAIPDKRTIDSLLDQVCNVEVIECGPLRDVKDKRRYTDIGKGCMTAFKRAIDKEDEFFVINNSGALHINKDGIAKCIAFLKENLDWAGVSLPNRSPVCLEPAHVMQECIVYRTEAVKGIEDFITWDEKSCECIKIRNSIVKYKGLRLGYLEKAVNHIKDIGRGFTIPAIA